MPLSIVIFLMRGWDLGTRLCRIITCDVLEANPIYDSKPHVGVLN